MCRQKKYKNMTVKVLIRQENRQIDVKMMKQIKCVDVRLKLNRWMQMQETKINKSNVNMW